MSPPRVWCNNVSAISLGSNPVFHSRMKHVEVDYYYIRDKVVRKEISVDFMYSEDQLANIFTKGLHPKRFKLLASKLPVQSRPVSLQGCNDMCYPLHLLLNSCWPLSYLTLICVDLIIT